MSWDRETPAIGEWSQTTIDGSTLRRRLLSPVDEEAWRLVVERYGPLVERFARRSGLGREEAADVRQDALLAFAEAVRGERFDGARGGLRAFLFGITRNKIIDLRRKRARRGVSVMAPPNESDFFANLPAEDGLETLWEEEWIRAVRKRCLREAKTHFKADTYGMFYEHGIKGRPSIEVAEELGRTAAAVDMATHRVRAFLREVFPVLYETF